MGLLDFLKSNKDFPEVRDLVWMNNTAKEAGIRQLAQRYPEAVWIAWFEQSQATLSPLFEKPEALRLARQVSPATLNGKTVVFVEHYPLKGKEQKFISAIKVRQVLFLNSMEEPLFQKFGGPNIVSLLEKLNAGKEEALEHTMISKSIVKAQAKLDAKVQVESAAISAHEWFQKNLKDHYH